MSAKYHSVVGDGGRSAVAAAVGKVAEDVAGLVVGIGIVVVFAVVHFVPVVVVVAVVAAAVVVGSVRQRTASPLQKDSLPITVDDNLIHSHY